MASDAKYFDDDISSNTGSAKRGGALKSSKSLDIKSSSRTRSFDSRYIDDEADGKEEHSITSHASAKSPHSRGAFKKQETDDSIDEVDKEFEAMLRKPNTGESYFPIDESAVRIFNGLKM